MKSKIMLRSTAMTSKQYAEPKRNMKTVTTYPKVEFEAADVPELSGKPTDHECILIIKVRKVKEGKEDSWNIPPGKDPRNMVTVEILGTMSHESEKEESLEEVQKKKRADKGY